ncbi:MAG: succinylglutamate desuccinylase/aspartoacylase family protein [Pirellulales bacterium]|nr:succinylglutamate desuccinylase/aspartoacylase family protein [Pirellulales bacterium]
MRAMKWRDTTTVISTRALLVDVLVLMLLVGVGRAEVSRTSGLIAEGSKWENPYSIVDSGVEGPTLLITGGLHGNEPAGYRAAEQIRHWPIRCGKLIVVPRGNTPGLKQGTRWLPGEPDATRNANRNFPKTGEPNEARSVAIKALWKFMQDQSPDWVVDLHEGFDFNIVNAKSDGSSIIYFDTPEMQELAAKIHNDVNSTIANPDRRIVKRSKSGPINGGLVRAAVERLGARGFCFETTYSKQPISIRTRQHRIMVHRLMRELDMVGGQGVNLMTSPDDEAIRVAVYDAGGTGGKGVENLERILESKPTFLLHHVGPEDIRAGVLGQFDVVIFPGGSGSKEAAAIGRDGCAAVQEFVGSGGGYVGICAGAFLATAKYDWSLALVDAKTFTGNREIPGVGVKSMWFRGSGAVKMELTDEGRAILGDLPGLVEVRYANGPILSSAGKEDLPDYVLLAVFRTEISKYEPQEGTMIDTPAIVASEFGAGRAIAISPHPEATAGLESLVQRAVAWVAGESGSVYDSQ